MKTHALALYAVVATCLVGCKLGARAREVVNIVAVDRSGSTKAMRPQLKGLLAEAFNQCQDRNQTFAVWAVDRQSVCLYGPRRSDADRLPPEVFTQLGVDAAPSTSVRTRPALLWEAMAAKYGRSAITVRIAYLTDGGNDYAGDLPRIRAAAAKLGGNPRVFVTISGVQPDQRNWLESAFAPLGGRFQIGSRGEEALALEQWIAQGTRTGTN